MIATIVTNKGTMKVNLFEKEAPITVENFKKYAEEGFYDNTIFHRVINGFMIQGGGFTKDGVQKETQAPIKNEAKNGLSNKRGTLAMARTNAVDSATSQFFINHIDNSFLDYKNDMNYGYAVFAELTEGFEVLDEIAKVKTGTKSYFQDWPVEDVIIEKITIE
ncbi:peptidylprolyl isomerase [Methanococcus voltae]|uniref:peptidylprolyl isomerase n=2 Tax=Methanococcus voltae TaxID=2188 RepID=A0A8J7UV31_METVO|nr:peptidylprolyl isomerase [Methanococcus voltae]MBP2172968.1 peptidyl-prolyl cis-trans isomerase B (cyclophilin B) [Methanococcus voltae]MBP2201976.1 peptidyl-prolyl cis-trans isomerase B (cyclophilin B) [Methanococcus voltae]MCS3922139.1 peptidyl-prolyl cis-trans isomerase B (cyclophilin B) [Methanococcus voltae PS]